MYNVCNIVYAHVYAYNVHAYTWSGCVGKADIYTCICTYMRMRIVV